MNHPFARHADPRRRIGSMACAMALMLAPAGAALAAATPAARPAAAADADAVVEFDPAMLSGHSRRSIDLSRFEKGIDVLPGQYNVDIYLDKQWVGRTNVRFASPEPDTDAVPCMSTNLLRLMQLQDQVVRSVSGPDGCTRIGDLLPGARAVFDMSSLRLDISVPQALMGNQPRGYVDPSSWDAGVPAFLLNYRFNTYNSRNHGYDMTSSYLGLDAALNIGLWQFRDTAGFSMLSGHDGAPSSHHWYNIDAYAQRALPSLKAELTLGDSHTDGAVFDSIALRGVQLATDDRMRPQSRRGYAPVVRGVAETNAMVTVRQNGVQIYQTTVAPGPFVIDDLYPTGYGGSLEVTVTEADGRRHAYEVPYASVSQLVRPGVTRFGIAAGQLRNLPFDSHPRVIQGTIQHGFGNRFTAYAGFQGSQGYAAALLGGALNTRFGALALDITQAGVTLPGQGAHTGQSVRATWSKMLPATRTAISVAAYRYSTDGFLDLTDAAIARAYAERGLNTFQYQPEAPTINGMPAQSPLTPAQQAALAGHAGVASFVPRGLLHQRNRFTLSLNQPLGDRGGSLYANVSFRDYWNRGDNDTLFQVGYNNHFRRLSYSISASRTRSLDGRLDNRVSLNFSLPLGDSPRAPRLNANFNHDSRGYTQEQVMLSGSAGKYNQFSWGANASHDNLGNGTSVAVNAGYRASHAVFNASYGKGDGFSQAAFGMNGALAIHAGGITFGQPTGDTVALVHVPHATGAHVLNAPGVTIDHDGYALVPYLRPYQMNTLRIDPAGLPLGVQLDATSLRVAPYAGAVIMADFKTHYGRALIARIHRADGTPVPFGAEVFDANGNPLGVVGQGGLALLRGVQRSGQLQVKWRDGDATDACLLPYALPASDHSAEAYPHIRVSCPVASTKEGGA